LLSSFVIVIAKDIPTGENDLIVNDPIRPVPVAFVEKTPSNKIRCFPAKVRANRRVELAFSVSGQLEELNGEEGRNLKKGELIAQLDQRDYLYRFNIAQAKLENAEKELDRCKNLWDQKVISDTDYDNAILAYKISLAEFQIKKKALEDTAIYAPFNGIIVKRFVENQEHVQEKRAIVSFQDISKIEVVVQIPEQMLASGGVHALKNPQVSFDKDGENWFDAVIREYSALSNETTHTYDVVFSLSTPANMHVFPGMIAQVRTELDLHQTDSLSAEKLRIPVNALVYDDAGNSYVWKIDPMQSVPCKTNVKIQQVLEDYADIDAELLPGDRVAVAGLNSLNTDVPVRPMVSGKEGLEG